MSGPIAVVGIPSALGGTLPGDRHVGMASAPADLRRLGFLARLASAGLDLGDRGDLPIASGSRDDPDPRVKNRAQVVDVLRRATAMVEEAMTSGQRLLTLGGDCCAHAAAMAGLRRAHPDRRLAIAWFDAHGDFNTPETTPSGNVWGMPFALLCGRGPSDLVEACDGPSVDERHAALLGGQILDEPESRMLMASSVASFGAGMLRTAAGLAALEGWATTVAREVDGLYIAVDHDVLDADEAAWAVTMPEAAGLPLASAIEAVGTLATAMPVVGYGATAMNFAVDADGPRTVDAAAQLAIAALG